MILFLKDNQLIINRIPVSINCESIVKKQKADFPWLIGLRKPASFIIVISSLRFYLVFHHHFWRYVLHAGKVASHTWFVAVNAARPTRHVELYGIFWALVPSHKACVRVGGTPDAHHWRVDKRCQMHIAAIHAQHNAEMTHENQLV